MPLPPVTAGGAKLQPAWDPDSPASDSETLSENPFVSDVDTANDVLPPGATVADAGDAVTVKSGTVVSH